MIEGEKAIKEFMVELMFNSNIELLNGNYQPKVDICYVVERLQNILTEMGANPKKIVDDWL